MAKIIDFQKAQAQQKFDNETPGMKMVLGPALTRQGVIKSDSLADTLMDFCAMLAVREMNDGNTED